ncbi:MAG: FGGY family carbohydrate kinase [Acidimicrobiales bacterium]
MSILVIDAGTSNIRAAVVTPDGAVGHVVHQAVPPSTPSPGFVELDPRRLAGAALEVAGAALDAGGPVEGVGIANQRASTIVWDRATGEPVGPGIGWQDLRTVGMCLALAADGIRVAPNTSATKAAVLLDMADPDRERDLCVGTVDSWLAWTLSAGTVHVTDATNAGLTGLVRADATGWSDRLLEALRVPAGVLPTIVDSSGVVGEAVALPGRPPIAGMAGDQQASLVGQGCTRPGLAKATFGTGGMLDQCLGERRPGFETRGPAGTFPVVAWQRAGRRTWGAEAVMLSAGSAVDWLRDDLGIIASSAESDALAASCPNAGDAWFVPALAGLGTPVWDFGARGTLLGATRGTGRPEVVRAVLEGVAHRGADLVEAAESDSGLSIGSLRVDGGMTANQTFLQALANACQRPVEVSPVMEATTLGAAYLAGLALGTWADEDEIAAAWAPRQVVEPTRRTDRDRWRDMRARAERTVPELSALEF